MKKLFSVTVLVLVLQLVISHKANAQKGTNYTNALGMRIDLGSDYGTYVGFSGKHFFNTHNAGEAMVLFGDHTTMLQVEYQYHGKIENAAGLRWYAGLGPGFAFASKYYGGTDVLIRPLIGLDYKIKDVPLNFSFDWRPAFVVTHGTDFNAARFGLAFRYAF